MTEPTEEGKSDVDKFKNSLMERIDYFRVEFRLNYAEIIGVLDIVKIIMIDECLSLPGRDDEGET